MGLCIQCVGMWLTGYFNVLCGKGRAPPSPFYCICTVVGVYIWCACVRVYCFRVGVSIECCDEGFGGVQFYGFGGSALIANRGLCFGFTVCMSYG